MYSICLMHNPELNNVRQVSQTLWSKSYTTNMQCAVTNRIPSKSYTHAMYDKQLPRRIVSVSNISNIAHSKWRTTGLVHNPILQRGNDLRFSLSLPQAALPFAGIAQQNNVHAAHTPPSGSHRCRPKYMRRKCKFII